MGTEPNPPSVEGGTISEEATETATVETEKSRRALLKGLGVAAAGAVIGRVLTPREAQAHGTFHQDSDNVQPAIHGNNSSNSPLGPGVQGTSNSGIGVEGISDEGDGVVGRSTDGTGVLGQSTNKAGLNGFSFIWYGVEGHSNSGIGVGGFSFDNIGVDGRSESLIGVNGFSPGGIGVEGRSDNGIGVDGNGGNVGVIGTSDGGTGVLAQSFGNGLALDVHGPAKFSTAGAGTIPAQQNSIVVNDPAVTAVSHVTMTLTGDPGSSASGLPAVVVWVERQPGVGFIARLSRRVAFATPFTYLIVEPG